MPTYRTVVYMDGSSEQIMLTAEEVALLPDFFVITLLSTNPVTFSIQRSSFELPDGTRQARPGAGDIELVIESGDGTQEFTTITLDASGYAEAQLAPGSPPDTYRIFVNNAKTNEIVVTVT